MSRRAEGRAAGAPDRPLIVLRGVRKTYEPHRKDAWVLRGVDLDVAPGEFVSIMGASGSGKSTLLNLIGGLDRRYEGSAEVAGQELRKLGDRALSRFRNVTIGFVFQSFHLLPHLTVRQNVGLPASFNRVRSAAETARLVEDALRRCEIDHKADAHPNHLSGGERQRVAIARALFNHPRILLCDEPTGSLDQRTGETILGLFEELNRQEDITLVIVTHEPRIAARADRVIHVRDGLVVGAPEAGPAGAAPGGGA